MSYTTFVKDPDEVLDFVWDWSSWLATGETISTATVTAPTGITLDSSTNSTTTVTAWLSGGTVGQTYLLDCKIVTSSARTADRDIYIRVTER